MPVTATRNINLITLAVTILVLTAAYFIEIYYEVTPCPLCILQRICLFACIFTLLARTVHKKISRFNLLGYAFPLIAFSISGFSLAVRQVWLQAHPSQSNLCLPGISDLAPSGFLHWLFSAFSGDANCAVVTWQFLGLSMASWSALVFIVLLLCGFLNILGFFHLSKLRQQHKHSVQKRQH